LALTSRCRQGACRPGLEFSVDEQPQQLRRRGQDAIGEGLQQSIQSRLSGFGADLITVSPGGGRAFGIFGGGGPGGFEGGGGTSRSSSSVDGNLTVRDIQVLKTVENVKYVEGTISGRAEIYYLAEKANANIQGVDPLIWKEITNSQLEQGRFLGPSDYSSVVIGSRVASSTFKETLGLNTLLTIEGKNFKIVGILKSSGTEDNAIFMPIQAARDTIPDITSGINFDSITIKAESVDYVDTIVTDATSKLMISRHVTGKTANFRITSSKQIQENVTQIANSLTIFLGAIAAVSLLVGGIGIANTMFTTVLEKTKEIGIMKSIGAKNGDIMMIFMINSSLVGLVGGIIGVTLGSAISLLLPELGLMAVSGGFGGLTTAITPSLILFGLLIAIGIGTVSGLVPAYRASKLKPVEALRYE
jgi:putative ABC transport system permease protein